MLFAALPAAAQTRLAIESTRLVDDGDLDGIPDTGESVSLFLTVRNASGAALPEQQLVVSTESEEIDCIAGDALTVPALAPGETVELPPYRILVGAIDRATSGLTAANALAIELSLSIVGPVPTTLAPSRLSIDLDLDLSGGDTPGSFVEGFETGLGAFEGETTASSSS